MVETANKNTLRIEAKGREITVTRTFDAPRDLVWKAWTEAESLSRWFAPKGWIVPHCTVDFRPGGVWHFLVRGPEGEESWGRAVYREINPKDRFVYEDAFSDQDGNVTPGLPVCIVTMEFEDEGSKTRVTSRGEYASEAELKAVVEMGVEQGIGEVWDRLAEYLAAA